MAIQGFDAEKPDLQAPDLHESATDAALAGAESRSTHQLVDMTSPLEDWSRREAYVAGRASTSDRVQPLALDG